MKRRESRKCDEDDLDNELDEAASEHFFNNPEAQHLLIGRSSLIVHFSFLNNESPLLEEHVRELEDRRGEQLVTYMRSSFQREYQRLAAELAKEDVTLVL